MTRTSATLADASGYDISAACRARIVRVLLAASAGLRKSFALFCFRVFALLAAGAQSRRVTGHGVSYVRHQRLCTKAAPSWFCLTGGRIAPWSALGAMGMAGGCPRVGRGPVNGRRCPCCVRRAWVPDKLARLGLP